MILKQLVIGALASSLAIAGAFLYAFTKTSSSEDFRIAIFQPAQHPALDEIARGFSESLTKRSKKRYKIDFYNAGGSSTLLRSQADELLSYPYDLVFTIGAQCSQIVYTRAQKKGLKIPQVFAAVDDPQGLGIVQSIPLSGTQATGVLATRFYKEQLEALMQVKPKTKHILLVYDPTQGSGLEKDRKALEQILSSKGISLQAVEIAHSNEISQKVPAFLPSTDVVLVLMDNTLVTGISTLIGLCERYKVPLYASDLASGKKGAVLSFGAEDYEYGAFGAELAFSILEQKKDPANIPLMQPPQHRLVVNTDSMNKQGLVISDTVLNQINKQRITS